MNFVNKMEKKFGRYAIHNLMLYLIILYVVGFFIINTNPAFYVRYLSLDAGAILHGQIWRILTYVIYPPSTNIFWLVLASYIYYSLGRTLEQVIGTFRFNLFIFIGILGNVLAAIIIYLLLGETYLLTADNLYMSMLLAMAVTFPDMKFLLFYLIPIPAKWLGCAYGALLVYQFIMGSLASKISIVMALLNFIFYFFMVRRPVQSAKQTKRKVVYQMQQNAASAGPRHRCAVCGRTEKDDPDLEFRFCSKCEGGLEYCKDHLYTHVHVTKGKKEDHHEEN